MKKISFFLILTNLAMFWDEQPPIILAFGLLLSLLSLWAGNITRPAIKQTVTIVGLLASLALVRLNFTPFISAESVIAFIILLASLKLFELKSPQDYFHLFLILNLELASLLILKPTFLVLVYVLAQLGTSFYFVLRLNQTLLKDLNFKRVLLYFAPALPMGLLFFFLFPRFTSGFAQSPNAASVESGFSNRIDVDLLTPMNLTTKSLFKVKFKNGQKFQNADLYWRGAVLWETDGLHWNSSNFSLVHRQDLDQVELETDENKRINYEVFLEPDAHLQIFLLDYPDTVDLDLANYRRFKDGSFEFRHKMFLKNHFQASSVLGKTSDLMSAVIRRKALKVRGEKHLALETFLKELYGEKSLDPEEKIQKLNQYFSNGFTYTLSPPTYKTMDEFILKNKLGYCSHFATAYALLARLSQIPARVINGFQGGEYNEFGEFYRVEGKDAHAWVEVYLEKTGWTRIDPTALVNPNRIALGASLFNEQVAPFFEVAGLRLEKRYFRFQFLDKLSQYIDALNNDLSLFFYAFDQEYQRLLSERLNLNRRFLGLYAALAFAFFLVGSYLVMIYVGRLQKDDEVLKQYKKLLKKLEKKGLSKLAHEGPEDFKLRVKEKFPDEVEIWIPKINQYIQKKYGR